MHIQTVPATDAIPYFWQNGHVEPIVESLFHQCQIDVAPRSLLTLKEKVVGLEDLKTKLAKAQEHPTRDKLIALFAMIVALSLIALPIIVGLRCHNNAIRVPICVGAPLMLMLLGVLYDHKWSVLKARRSEGYLFGVTIFAPLIPLHTFGQITRYETKIQEQEMAVKIDLQEIKDFLRNNSDKMPEVQRKLQASIEGLEGAIRIIDPETIPIPDAVATASLQRRLTDLRTVEEQLRLLTALA